LEREQEDPRSDKTQTHEQTAFFFGVLSHGFVDEFFRPRHPDL
jgi:hypothetical protein